MANFDGYCPTCITPATEIIPVNGLPMCENCDPLRSGRFAEGTAVIIVSADSQRYTRGTISLIKPATRTAFILPTDGGDAFEHALDNLWLDGMRGA